ncbi:hypothetical protein DMENIID0001_120170 [Sergentomyia squamirostris]
MAKGKQLIQGRERREMVDLDGRHLDWSSVFPSLQSVVFIKHTHSLHNSAGVAGEEGDDALESPEQKDVLTSGSASPSSTQSLEGAPATTSSTMLRDPESHHSTTPTSPQPPPHLIDSHDDVEHNIPATLIQDPSVERSVKMWSLTELYPFEAHQGDFFPQLALIVLCAATHQPQNFTKQAHLLFTKCHSDATPTPCHTLNTERQHDVLNVWFPE